MAKSPRLSLPPILLAERTATVELLLAIIEQQQNTIAALEQRVSALEAEDGRRARDTFVSLNKTCHKLGVRFWDYLLDRLTLSHTIPPLPQVVADAASRAR